MKPKKISRSKRSLRRGQPEYKPLPAHETERRGDFLFLTEQIGDYIRQAGDMLVL